MTSLAEVGLRAGLSHLSRLPGPRPLPAVGQNRRKSSETSADSRTPQIGMTTDGSTVLCWHPEPQFPYQFSKPLPRREPEIMEGDTVLKVQHLLDEKLKFRADGPTNNELANMFFTSKHRWFSVRPKFRKRNPPHEKESL